MNEKWTLIKKRNGINYIRMEGLTRAAILAQLAVAIHESETLASKYPEEVFTYEFFKEIE